MTDEGSLLIIAAPGLLGNDTDVDGDPLTALLVWARARRPQPEPRWQLSYLANADYFGTDSFSYRINDGQADSNLALAALTINPVNDAPVANDDNYTRGQTLQVLVLSGISPSRCRWRPLDRFARHAPQHRGPIVA